MFLRDAWYVACWSHQVAMGEIAARTIVGEPIILYRTSWSRIAGFGYGWAMPCGPVLQLFLARSGMKTPPSRWEPASSTMTRIVSFCTTTCWT